MRYVTTQRPSSFFEFMTDVEKSFEEIWGPTSASAREQLPTFTPAVDLHESPEFFLVSLDLPGVNLEDIKIDVQDERLSVSGERTRVSKNEDGLFKRFERAHGKFERVFQLPKNIDAAKVQARFENGVLEVMIPKAELAKPRSVAIESGKSGLFSKVFGQKTVEASSPQDNH